MTYRLTFGKADINYLANLCHNCGACLHACQYAPPHEFGVNVPQGMAKVRVETYQEYAWPASFGMLYKRAGMAVVLALAFGIGLFLLLVMALNGSLLHQPLAGDFYQIFPITYWRGCLAAYLYFRCVRYCSAPESSGGRSHRWRAACLRWQKPPVMC